MRCYFGSFILGPIPKHLERSPGMPGNHDHCYLLSCSRRLADLEPEVFRVGAPLHPKPYTLNPISPKFVAQIKNRKPETLRD